MSRIITNVPSMLAQRILNQQNQALTVSLERLSTGLRINRGADDPAGLIASENLRAEKVAISAAISNGERADQVINIAEGGLTEISNLLTELESLVDQTANDAGLSAEEKEANQLQIDSILQTIDRIANSTSFQGTKLLNGTYAYQTSGITSTELEDVAINAARIPEGGFIGVTLDVVQSAQNGTIFLSLNSFGSDNVSGTSITIEVAGNLGAQQFTFASGSVAQDIVSAVNTFAGVTGVSAAASGTDVVFASTGFGSTQFASVTKTAGDSTYDGIIDGTDASLAPLGAGSTTATDYGRNATVTINGTQATTDGLAARVSNASLDVDIAIAEAFNSNGGTSTFQITGGGATFNISPKLDLAGKASLGITAVTTGRLGSVANGRLSALAAGGSGNVVNGDVDSAQRIVRDAISMTSTLRGRLGAFQKNTIGAMIRSLGVALENTSAAESQIRDTDFASETASLTRQQILVNAATSVLSIANVQPQNVLALLG